jgi:protein-disulfide isomerase-like protein with CxxC motif
MTLEFAVTWDYRCPFARNAHEHLGAALASGLDVAVTPRPFSLRQAHVGHGETDVWDAPDTDTGLLALQVGVVVRERHPDRFWNVHLGLFAARHDEGQHLRDAEVLRDVLTRNGIDPDAVFAEIDGGWPLDAVRKEHEQGVRDHNVWGVPTFIVGDHAAFVRLMDRPADGRTDPRTNIERIVAMLDGWPELNEFKHTSLDR